MSKRRMNAVTDPSTPPSFGGYYKNARNVANLKLQAAAEGLVAVGLAGVGVYGAVELQALWPVAVGGTAALLTAVHTLALRQHTQDVVADLWRHEMAAGRDLDGDGEIGPPRRVTRYISIGGEMEPFVEEDEAGAGGQQQVMIDLVPGFEMSPRDLAELVELAATRGLGRGKLMGASLGSGSRVSKGMWERFTREAGERGWIEPGANGNGGRWRVRPESVVRALRMVQTGPADRSTGRAGGRAGGMTGVDQARTGWEVGEGRA
jgi:hypothetical protein